MSRAGIKQKRNPADERRVPTNLTLPADLRDWGVAHAAKLGLPKASLSELITRLLEAERESKSLLGESSAHLVDELGYHAGQIATEKRARVDRHGKVSTVTTPIHMHETRGRNPKQAHA
ncbi:MAG TPA: hypothetical protein VK163_05540 [Opitutaceae bacterium]|nr:hypothetical protein [Opitutaceae bacterium]